MGQSATENYEGVWDNRLGYGERPALLVIDFLRGYTTEGAPLFAPGVVEAVAATPPLLEAARQQRLPVLHTQVRFNPHSFEDAGVWLKKAPALRDLVEGNPFAAFCEGVEPLPTETVISKNYASAFFGTSLSSTLTALGVDTVLIAGCTTSGCIRASAVDTLQHGFRPIVVRECVGDRHEDPHRANLFDIDAKYGDVVSREDAIEYIKGARAS